MSRFLSVDGERRGTARPAGAVRAAVLLSTLGDSVARSERVGSVWSTQRVLEGQAVRCFATSGGGTVWAGTQGQGVLRSDDAGASWRPAGLDGRIVKAIAPDPHDRGVVYAGLKPAGLAVTRDGGETWSELEGFRKVRGRRLWFSPAEKPGTAYVQGLGVSPSDPDLVIAGIEFGAVVRSEDAGRTWSGHRRGAIRDCHSLTFHASDGGYVYEGGAGWPRRPFATSRDGGRTWSSPQGADLGYGWASAADPADPDTVYVSAASGPIRAHGNRPARAKIYRSRSGGDWQVLTGGLPTPLDAFPYALVTDPRSPGHLYAGLSDGTVWFTASHGDAWARLDVELGAIERAMVVVWG